MIIKIEIEENKFEYEIWNDVPMTTVDGKEVMTRQFDRVVTKEQVEQEIADFDEQIAKLNSLKVAEESILTEINNSE